MTFYFYDLETTGINSREGRIMQFAGQRTDMDLKPIGQPDNILIKITEDILPEPDAVLITGITPQKTIKEGITEAEFCRYFDEKINKPGTVFVGYNTIRFDDEFMRHLFYRNFYDSYEWQWQDGNSRWDLLDVVRMTRALRPDGIKWPFASDGRPSNQLGLITSINGLDHDNAHDALSDVQATIAVARLIKSKQPDLFSFLLEKRTKKEVQSFVAENPLFVYSSGKYPSEFEKTTVVAPLLQTALGDGMVVYDLRHDPRQFADFSLEDLVQAWRRYKPEEGPVLPVKTLKFNKCPAIAPPGIVLKDKVVQKRLRIDPEIVLANYKTLKSLKDWPKKLQKALELMDKERQASWLVDIQDVDNQLYDGFLDRPDRQLMQVVRAAEPDEISNYEDEFQDKRLQTMLPLYKARNYKASLTPEELKAWQDFRRQRLTGDKNNRYQNYQSRIKELLAQPKLSQASQHLLKDLEAYGQAITKFD